MRRKHAAVRPNGVRAWLCAQRELKTGTFGSQDPKIQNLDPGRRIDAQERAREHHGARRQPPCTALRSPLGSEPVPYIVLELAPRSNQ